MHDRFFFFYCSSHPVGSRENRRHSTVVTTADTCWCATTTANCVTVIAPVVKPGVLGISTQMVRLFVVVHATCAKIDKIQ